MPDRMSRRQALIRIVASGVGAALSSRALAFSGRGGASAPPIRDIRFGYAAITWGGHDEQAIADIASVGFRGIQLRSNVLEKYGQRPAALRELLAAHHLPMIALSSGNLRLDPAVEAEEIEKHTANARFVRDVGGQFLQVIDERPKGRTIERADYPRLGRLMTELGKRTADLGVPLAYHHHMNSLGERPDEIAPILEATEARYVKLLLDVAHWQQGGGDPVKAVRDYADRLGFLHIKDVQSPVPLDSGESARAQDNPERSRRVPGATGDVSRSYRFVELGRGSVDLKAVFAALAEVRFTGWAIVELDRVPDANRTPKESALINKQYLEGRLGFTV